MKQLLKSKAGVTVLEGIIALGLLALVAGGAFGVLLAASRQTSQPDVREEMVFAVEKVKNLLQMYTGVVDESSGAVLTDAPIPDNFRQGLCGGDQQPMSWSGPHHVKCMLPPICDQRFSDFTYELDNSFWAPYSGGVRPDRIKFKVTCNGYEL